MASASKEEVIGKLNVRVVRGNNLVIADPLTHTSDPYVVLQYGAQVHVHPTIPAPLAFSLFLCHLVSFFSPAALPGWTSAIDGDSFAVDDPCRAWSTVSAAVRGGKIGRAHV